MKEITAYKCGFCSKIYQRAGNAKKHELACKKNPENDRICFNCTKLCKREVTLYTDNPYGSGERKIDIMYCSGLDSFVYPPEVERKGNEFCPDSIEDGEIENTPMKRECDLFEDKYKNLMEW